MVVEEMIKIHRFSFFHCKDCNRKNKNKPAKNVLRVSFFGNCKVWLNRRSEIDSQRAMADKSEIHSGREK